MMVPWSRRKRLIDKAQDLDRKREEQAKQHQRVTRSRRAR